MYQNFLMCDRAWKILGLERSYLVEGGIILKLESL